jgi:hypothetical protein
LDNTRSKRVIVAFGVLVVALSAMIIEFRPEFSLVLIALMLQGVTGGILGPAIAAISAPGGACRAVEVSWLTGSVSRISTARFAAWYGFSWRRQSPHLSIMPMRPEGNQPTVPYQGFDVFERGLSITNSTGTENTNISQGDNRLVLTLYPVE